MTDEGVLEPWIAEWLEANPISDDFSDEYLKAARGSVEMPVTRDIAHVRDDVIAGIPVRIYEHGDSPTGLIVYSHGGGWSLGSVSLMDNVAREFGSRDGRCSDLRRIPPRAREPIPRRSRRLREGHPLGTVKRNDVWSHRDAGHGRRR